MTHPSSQTVAPGQSATFSAAATGNGPLTYQWQKNEASVSGATASTYTTPPVTLADSGAKFRVLVSNAAGSTTSNPATLTVDPNSAAPSISQQPTNQTVYSGQSAMIVSAALGTPLLGYQWIFNGTNVLAEATNATLTLNNVQLANAGNYSVLVTNAYGSAISTNAFLMVLQAPPCTVAPSNLLSWWRGEGNATDSDNADPGDRHAGDGDKD